MTSSAKTLRALRLAEMQWMKRHAFIMKCNCYQCAGHKPLYRAIAALKRKRTGRR